MRFTRISWLCMLAACRPDATPVSHPSMHFALTGGAYAAVHNGADHATDVVMNDAGAGVAATFEGTGVALDLRNSDADARVYYQVTLDGNSERLVHATTATSRYTYDELAPGVHCIALRRLNGADHGKGHLTHLAVLHHGSFLTGPEAPHRVEFVGGDLTAGVGLEDMDDAFGWAANATLSLAGQTAKGLHADYRVRLAQGWAPAHGWQPHAVVVEMHDQVDLTVQKIQRAYPQADIVLMLAPNLEGETLQAARSAAAATGLPLVEFRDPEAGRGDTYGHYVMARALRRALQETAHWQTSVSVAGSSGAGPASLF